MRDREFTGVCICYRYIPRLVGTGHYPACPVRQEQDPTKYAEFLRRQATERRKVGV